MLENLTKKTIECSLSSCCIIYLLKVTARAAVAGVFFFQQRDQIFLNKNTAIFFDYNYKIQANKKKMSPINPIEYYIKLSATE